MIAGKFDQRLPMVEQKTLQVPVNLPLPQPLASRVGEAEFKKLVRVDPGLAGFPTERQRRQETARIRRAGR